jgi:hypothetical protein
MRALILLLVFCLALVGPSATTAARAADGEPSGFWISLWGPSTSAALIFLYGAFCALWAQNTGRNAWLWFVLGAVFSIFAVVMLLVENAKARDSKPFSDAGRG